MLLKLPTVGTSPDASKNNDYLPHIEYRCALVAEAVYNRICLKEKGLPLATEKQINEVFAAGIEALINDDDGVKEQLYYDERTGLYILAFGGTEPANINDWIQNFAQFAGLGSQYYLQGMALVKAIRPEYKDKVLLTGHSLGGGVATVAATAGQLNAIVFNPPTIHKNTLNQFTAEQVQAAKNNVQRFVVAGEILDLVNHTLGVNQHRIGRKITLYGSFTIPLSSVLSLSALLKRFIPGVGPIIGVLAPLLEKSVELHSMREVFVGLKKDKSRTE
jgi:hypothetical protein